ncbi:MAG: hypothetical protein COB53_03985 [Elusimicrobia bacterium]|nr:MAG: hypothetical protein COB53_03985 [Elusimicrobiota bacterium]
MGRFFKYGIVLCMLAWAGYGMYQLKQISEVKKDLDSGLAPEDALKRLMEQDKTGVISKLVEANSVGMARLDILGGGEGELDAEGLEKMEALQSQLLSMSGDSAKSVKSAAVMPKTGEALPPSEILHLKKGERVEAGPGVAVLVDEKTGERIVLRSSEKSKKRRSRIKRDREKANKKGGSLLDRIPLPSLPPAVADALGIKTPTAATRQRWKAYALMGTTLLGTIVLVLWARRKFT